jgi:sarcosine oxidase, subunit beta
MASAAPSVCVVGGGALGLSSALALARRGAGAVTLIEGGYIAGASSGLSVGIVETQYVEPLDIELRVRAMESFDRLVDEHGLELVRNGYLRLGHSPAAAERFEASVAVQHELGVRDARVVGRDEIRELVPEMRVDDVVCGLFGPRDGYLDGHLYCTLLAELAEGLGVSIRQREPLQAAEPRAGGGHRLLTAKGAIEADVVVNAAGAWAPRVAELLGGTLTLVPQRHQAVIVHLSRDLGYLVPSVMDYTPGSGQSGLYFRHERPGQLVAGLHTEEAVDAVANPDEYARSADEDFLVKVAELITERLPPLADSSLAHGWAGLYPASSDGRAQVGPMPDDDSVVAAAGAGGSGIQTSPVIGELVADWVLHGAPRIVPGAERLRPSSDERNLTCPT